MKSQELIDLRITSAAEHITEAGLHASSAKLLPPDSVLVAMYGATVGQLGYLQIAATVNQAICALITDPDVTDPRFLYYALMHARGSLVAHAHGAAQQNLSQDRIRKFALRVPEIDTQRCIADVLTAFDELIENNRRRIEVLEGIARSLYREWFVRYRFPGHESAEFVDSPIGKVPAGWTIEPVGDVVEVVGGGTPSRAEEEFWSGATVPWYTPTDLTRRTAMTAAPPRERISEIGLRKSSARIFPGGTVMLTSRATIGVSAIAPTEACTNQGFINCLPNDRFDRFQVLFWMRENVGTFISHASGATFKELSKSTFKKLLVLVPGEAEVLAFRAKVEPIVESAALLEAQAHALEETRDLLLPKLVTGRIDVESLGVDDVFGWAELASEPVGAA